ncbi:MAG: kelch repeat-containing protein [bacterium]
MNAVVVLEWHFSPPDYFEEEIRIARDDYTMSIADGKVEATIDVAIYDANPSLRGALHDALNDRLRMDTARFYSTATLLADGRVLVAGGYDNHSTASAKAWIYKT